MPLIDSSGAGASVAGVAPAGHDLPDDPSTRVIQGPRTANEFDPYKRVWTQEADLTMRPTSPVIQKAATLMLPRGSFGSTPESGIPLEGIRRSNPSSRAAMVRDALDQAWAPIISSGELAIVSVELEPGEPWSGRWLVTVRDTTTGDEATLTNT